MTVAELVARRGPLTPGQIVTVGVQIARELALLHATGQAHGAVSAKAIVVAADGRPSLTPATASGNEPLEDVRELAHQLRDLVDASVGLALLRVLGAPRDAVGFARDLYAVATPEPLLTSRDVATPAGQPPRLRGPRVVAALIACMVVAGLAGVAWARSESQPGGAVVPRSRPPTSASATDWKAVITRLDAVRDAAFVSGDPRALGHAYAPGSRVLVRELASLRALTSRHLHARGLQLLVMSVHVRSTASGAMVLDVVDRLPAYDIVDTSGRVVRHHSARGLRTWRIQLQQRAGGWRISNII